MPRRASPFLAALSLSLLASTLRAAPPLPKAVDFNRDIKPILADNCFKCHGPDKNQRKADLRLDTKTGLLGDGTEEGPVVPGKLDQSELYQRITEKDPERRMPAAASGKALTPRQIALLKLWIE